MRKHRYASRPTLDVLRNFIAVYRSGSVTEAAKLRGVSQSAVSQLLSVLESYAGCPLFERRGGMSPTRRADELFEEVWESVDCLERSLTKLGNAPSASSVIRLGATADYFEGFAVKRLSPLGLPLSVSFWKEPEMLAELDKGAIDVAICSQRPRSRAFQHRSLGEQRFALIGPPNGPKPNRGSSLRQLGEWLSRQAWVSYSDDRPITRSFWQLTLGRRFDAKPALVVADLRAVVAAVAHGVGISIVPEYVCLDAVADDRVEIVWPVGHLIPPEQRFAAFRTIDAERPEIIAIAKALAAV